MQMRFSAFLPIMGIIEKSLKGFRGAARDRYRRRGEPHVGYAIAGLEIGFHYTEMRLKLYLVGLSSMLDDACSAFFLYYFFFRRSFRGRKLLAFPTNKPRESQP